MLAADLTSEFLAADRHFSSGRKAEAVAVLVEAAKACVDAEQLRQIAIRLLYFKAAQPALELAGRVLTAMPHNPDSYALYANISNTMGLYAEARDICQAALGIKPPSAAVWLELGHAFRNLEQWDEAKRAYLAATEIKPDSLAAWTGLGTLCAETMAMEDALRYFDRALQVKPDFAATRFNRSLVQLSLGRYATGWQDHEYRFQCPGIYIHPQCPPDKQWRGEPVQGKTVLLVAEQGLGDTLHFIRYARLVRERGATVIALVQPTLMALLREDPDIHAVYPDNGPIPEHDRFVYLMSLPAVFATTVDTVPQHIPYLHPPAERVQKWRGILGEAARPRVGLVWAGGERKGNPDAQRTDRRRSLRLEDIRDWFLHDIQFVSLQKGESAERQLRESSLPVLDLTAQIHDFADTAAIVSCLDGVVSVDTSVAHLVAGMGKPLWLLNRFDSDWRWLVSSTPGAGDSVWYPGTRQFRQKTMGDWGGVTEAVDRALMAGFRLQPPYAGFDVMDA